MGKKVLGGGNKGLLYFAQNPAFHHLTKIGKTTKLSAEDRGLSASNVPDDFEYIAVLECDDVDWAEECVHEYCEKFRHKANTGRKTEFFWSGCVTEAINYAKKLKGVHDTTSKETEEVETTNEKGETTIVKLPRATITKDMINACYEYAKKYTFEKMDRDKAIANVVEGTKMNETSAGCYIDSIKCILQGSCYTRTISADATIFVCESIYKEYGNGGLRKALSAVEQHLDYYESKTGTRNSKIDEYIRNKKLISPIN